MVRENEIQIRWRGMAAVAAVLAAVLFLYPMTLDIPLLDPDEGLHASIAQEMVERGDWIIPRLQGEPFLDKPILYFWAEAFSLRVFGMHEAAVRLPGLMFGLLGAVTTGVVGWRMFGRGVGLVAGMFYGTMILPVALSQAATHDVALVPWVNLAVLLFWLADQATTRRAAMGYTLAIGVLLGLSCLTKGLVGVALVGVAYGTYLLVTRRLTVAACIRGAAALGIAALVASAWYLAVEMRSPGYLYYYFVERHLLGYVTDTQSHGDSPWWYYLPILLGGGLPWIGYLPVTLQDQWIRFKSKQRDASSSAMVLLWCWLIACTLFLSTSHSKLVTYVWPVFPAVAILAAVAWVRLFRGELTQAARKSILLTFRLSCLSGVVVLPIAMGVVGSKFHVQFTPTAWTIGVLTAFASWSALIFFRFERHRAMLSTGMLSMAAQYAVLMTFLFPPIAEQISARGLAEHFNQLGRVPPRVLLTEDRIGSLIFYLDPQLRSDLKAGQLEEIRVRELATLPPQQSETVVSLPERHLNRAHRHLDLADVEYQRAGSHRIYDARQLTSPARTARGDSPTWR